MAILRLLKPGSHADDAGIHDLDADLPEHRPHRVQTRLQDLRETAVGPHERTLVVLARAPFSGPVCNAPSLRGILRNWPERAACPWGKQSRGGGSALLPHAHPRAARRSLFDQFLRSAQGSLYDSCERPAVTS